MAIETPGVSTVTDPRPRSRAFLFVFTNIWFLCSVAIACLTIGVVVSLRTADWTWFARSGSVEGIIGAVLSCRSVLRLSPEERIRIRQMNVVETFTVAEFEDQERDSLAVQIGVLLLVGGTLIWAFGDLLSTVFVGA